MNFRLFTLSLLSLSLGCASARAQPTYKSLTPADYKAPVADLEKWATRLRKFCPEKGWTVSVENNDVLIQRDKPVVFNQYPWSKEQVVYEASYRLRLRFAPLMTTEKYEELDAANKLAKIENNRLLLKHDLTEVFGGGLKLWYPPYVNVKTDYSPQKLEASTKAYYEDSKTLVFYQLPIFYTTGYSITRFQSWPPPDFISATNSEAVNEVDSVEERLVRTFGTYAFHVNMGAMPPAIREPAQ